MRCEEFLERHAEYCDGLLPADEMERRQAHARACVGCARHERALERGVAALRAAPAEAVSPDFQTRLMHRLYHMDERRSWPRVAATAAAVAGLAAAGILSDRGQPLLVEVQLPAVTAETPAEAAPARGPGSLVRGPYRPNVYFVPFSPQLDDGGGLFNSTHDVTVATGDSVLLPPDRRTAQLDESR